MKNKEMNLIDCSCILQTRPQLSAIIVLWSPAYLLHILITSPTPTPFRVIVSPPLIMSSKEQQNKNHGEVSSRQKHAIPGLQFLSLIYLSLSLDVCLLSLSLSTSFPVTVT